MSAMLAQTLYQLLWELAEKPCPSDTYELTPPHKLIGTLSLSVICKIEWKLSRPIGTQKHIGKQLGSAFLCLRIRYFIPSYLCFVDRLPGALKNCLWQNLCQRFDCLQRAACSPELFWGINLRNSMRRKLEFSNQQCGKKEAGLSLLFWKMYCTLGDSEMWHITALLPWNWWITQVTGSWLVQRVHSSART